MRVARPWPGMPGKDHGRHRPDREPQRFQGEDGGAVADRAACDMARHDDDGTRLFRFADRSWVR